MGADSCLAHLELEKWAESLRCSQESVASLGATGRATVNVCRVGSSWVCSLGGQPPWRVWDRAGHPEPLGEGSGEKRKVEE